MTVRLYLSPSFENSLQHAAGQIREVHSQHPLLPLYALVPTQLSVHTLRRHLGDTMGVYLHRFYDLGQSLLDAAGNPVHWLSDTAIQRLVHHLLGNMAAANQLSTFAQVWDKPGFNRALVDWLREVKTLGIDPDKFSSYAEGSDLERERQLASLYQQYQRFLQEHKLSDAEGLLWLAAEALEQNPDLFRTPGLLVVLGFDQFNPLQERILGQLAGRFAEFALYLPWDSHRDLSSLALGRVSETRHRMRAILPELKEHILEERGEFAPHLLRLRQQLFEPVQDSGSPEPVEDASQRGVCALEAPSREVEVRLALRQIKQLLLSGVEPDDMVLLAPKPDAYRRMVELVAQEYGVPVNLEGLLSGNPAVQAFQNLLSLPPDFPWRPTLDALRSPYIHQLWLNPEQVDLLERLSRERPVVAGREQWQYALQPLTKLTAPLQSDLFVDEDLGVPRLVSKLDPQELETIQSGLLAFFDHLTPPKTSTSRQYILWLQQRILGLHAELEDEDDSDLTETEKLNLADCAEKGKYAQRDLRALQVLLQNLRALLAAEDLVQTDQPIPVDWATWRNELLHQLSSVSLTSEDWQPGVLFGRLEAGREKPYDYMFVLGLSEGEFPALPPADPFYDLQERCDHPLKLRCPRLADDASLWWLVLCNCHQQLTLLRPYLDNNGAPWEPSPYWQEVLDKVGIQARSIPVAYLPGIDQAASQAELLLALALNGAHQVPGDLVRPWEAAQQAYNVMRLRQSWQPAPAYEGSFQSDDLKAELLTRYRTDYAWSASRLNRYGECPYAFFADSILELQALEEPQEGFDPRQRGSLLHEVLEILHRLLGEQGLYLCLEHQETILALLEKTCASAFRNAPRRHGFRPTALWRYEQEELRRWLRALVAWECQTNRDYRSYQQELRFGLPGSHLRSQRFEASNGASFYLHGVIDRVDRDETNSCLRVLDYKSGRTAYSDKDITEGRALQTSLYAVVVEDQLGERVAFSAYLLIPKREFSGDIKATGSIREEQIVQLAIDRAAQFVENIRRGDFPALPSKPGNCQTYCDYYNLCRVNRQAIAKARRGTS